VTDLAFGVGLFPTAPLLAIVRLARVTEELGFSHAWIGDSHLIWREAYVTLAAAALATTRLTLGTGVTNLVTRHPAVVASALATLHEACPDRVILGLGLGDSAVETMGKKPSRLDVFARDVRRVRDLLAGRDVETETGTLRLKHAAGEGIRIYVAASGPRLLALAGRIADGVIVLVGIEPERVRQAVDTVRAGAREAGRDPDSLDLVLWVPCAVGDAAAARAAVKAHVARVLNRPLPFDLDAEEQRVVAEIRASYDYYQHMERGASQARVVPDWLVERFALAGAPDTCRAAVERLRGTGIGQVAIVPYGTDDGGREATMRAFAAALLGDGA
jgi:5,10-methylenetetrahydromethanopterin reductase